MSETTIDSVMHVNEAKAAIIVIAVAPIGIKIFGVVIAVQVEEEVMMMNFIMMTTGSHDRENRMKKVIAMERAALVILTTMIPSITIAMKVEAAKTNDVITVMMVVANRGVVGRDPILLQPRAIECQL
jgi:hypothetical protein